MQMLYFFDPELKRRASIAPPARLQSLEGVSVVNQKPADRTNNVISRPEAAADEAAVSHLEKGFLEELQGNSQYAEKQD